MNWERFILFLVIGFFAQLIDGTLGMAYGISCRTFLKTIAGLPAALASAAVHCAEMFTTLVSGISHLSLKNVSMDLLWRLMLPGVVGGVLGAWFLTRVGDVLEPFIDVYLIVMGFVILCRASRKERERPRRISPYVFPLGFVGGFLDATGGGGWGPVVTSTMLARGHDVKKTIGTVNTAEFVVTVAQTTTFFALLSDFTSHWQVILALIIGGMAAAPLAAWICKHCPVRPLLGIVGSVIIALNLYNFIARLA
ncbi:MAG: sulfite exporter TauE/SafE family protein [Ruminococcaceae bacterium]|nr:sulfite exporter TauE/SafE family protein [Oscillospiraceae bacterium]